MTPRNSDALHDSFRDWNAISAHRNVELVRRFARVPRRPDVRVSPADLNYDVPPDADLRQFASAQGIDVDAPWFRLPEQRRLRCGFFPLVTRLHSGALLAVWREASAHSYCSFGRTVAARSLDGGRSWSAPWVVDFRRPGAWDTGGPENLVQTGDGSLWLGAWARIPEPEPHTVGTQRPEMYVLRSHDEGQSWEQLPKLGDGFQFLCTPMLEFSNGEFLWLGSVPDPAAKGSPRTPRYGGRCSSCAGPASRSPPEPTSWSWVGCASSATAPCGWAGPTSVTSPRPPLPATW